MNSSSGANFDGAHDTPPLVYLLSLYMICGWNASLKDKKADVAGKAKQPVRLSRVFLFGLSVPPCEIQVYSAFAGLDPTAKHSEIVFGTPPQIRQ